MLAHLLVVALVASAAVAAPAPNARAPLPDWCATTYFGLENRDLAQVPSDGFVNLPSAYGSATNWKDLDQKACWAASHKSGHIVAQMEHKPLGDGRVAPTFRCEFKSVPTTPDYPGHSSYMWDITGAGGSSKVMVSLGQYTIPGYTVQVDNTNGDHSRCDVVSVVEHTYECKVFPKAENKTVLMGTGCF